MILRVVITILGFMMCATSAALIYLISRVWFWEPGGEAAALLIGGLFFLTFGAGIGFILEAIYDFPMDDGHV